MGPTLQRVRHLHCFEFAESFVSRVIRTAQGSWLPPECTTVAWMSIGFTSKDSLRCCASREGDRRCQSQEPSSGAVPGMFYDSLRGSRNQPKLTKARGSNYRRSLLNLLFLPVILQEPRTAQVWYRREGLGHLRRF